jgi:hypothetical protein
MKTILAAIALFSACMFLICLAAPASAALVDRRKKATDEIDADAMLDAIAQVESGNNPHAVNPVTGERGRCQFTEATWRLYTNADFATWAASGASFVRRIERQHLREVCAGLRGLGHRLTPELVAAAWLHWVELAAAHAHDDRSIRAGNLYRDALRNR